MRYLYGDLSEFPAQENVLDLLQRFVDMAVDALLLDAKIEETLAATEEEKLFMVETLSEIDRFAGSVQTAIEDSTPSSANDDVVSVIAQGAADQLDQFLSEAKRKLAQQIEQRIGRNQAEVASMSKGIHEAFRKFFTPSVIPIHSNALRCALHGQSYQATAEILDVNGILCGYAIDTSASTFFREPKRLAALCPGKLEFPVGTKKAWLKKEPVVETLRIDDATLSLVLDQEEQVEIRLIKKSGSHVDGVSAHIKKGRQGGISVFRLDAAGEETPVPESILNPAHTEALAEFWRQLSPAVRALYRTRGNLSTIAIDGKEVVSARLVVDLVRRLVGYLAPTIVEIGKRSPAKEEFCLKIDHEGGRREEIYVQKAELMARIAPLPADRQELFTPLNINPK